MYSEFFLTPSILFKIHQWFDNFLDLKEDYSTRLPLKVNELIPNFTDLADGNNNLFPFLKL